MAECEPMGFMFPMQADIYYPQVEQSQYGSITKTWNLDRTIACSLNPAGAALKEELQAKVDLTQDSLLMGRSKTDLRFSSLGEGHALTDIVISNIKNSEGQELYIETSGPRDGKSTIFEVATIQPYTNPFGKLEFYKVVLRRSENQGTEV